MHLKWIQCPNIELKKTHYVPSNTFTITMSSKWYDHHPQFCDHSFTVFRSELTSNVDSQAKHFSQMFPKANIISTTFKLFNTWIKCHRCVQGDLNASRAIIKFLAFRLALIFSQRNRETHIHTTSRKKIIKSPLTVKKSINFMNLTWKVSYTVLKHPYTSLVEDITPVFTDIRNSEFEVINFKY